MQVRHHSLHSPFFTLNHTTYCTHAQTCIHTTCTYTPHTCTDNCLCTCVYRTVGSEASSEQEPKDENCSLHWQSHGSWGEGGETYCVHMWFDHHLDSRHCCPRPQTNSSFLHIILKVIYVPVRSGGETWLFLLSFIFYHPGRSLSQCSYSIQSGAMSKRSLIFSIPTMPIKLLLATLLDKL